MSKNIVKALLEVSIAEAIFFVVAWYLQSVVSTGYGWYSKAFMILIGITAILFHGNPREYGLTFGNFKFNLKWCIHITLIFLLIWLATLLFSALFGSFTAVDPKTLLVDLVWFFMFVGFAEEMFFRGYIQSRLNEVFRKKYGKILWINFEWSKGTMIAGVFFFGLPHIFAGINPFTGNVAITPAVMVMAVLACFMGVVFGVIVEKTNSILVPTILHGLIDFTAFSLGRLTSMTTSNIAVGIAMFLFFFLIFERLLLEEIN
ncbi:MAG TPA: CPBP family intramembrane metalloprotease [Thermococcus sp.]|nr:CPBP family intramembrane metalloprotease [Thermococcus sp.]